MAKREPATLTVAKELTATGAAVLIFASLLMLAGMWPY